LQEELQVKEDEIRKVKEPLAYKEEELLRREEDLLYREKVMQGERRKVEEAKAQGGSTDELDMKSRLEELKGQINQKEEEVRTKEKYLQQKMEELRMREQGLIEEDIEAREQDLQIEVKQQKVKTGIPRLDDLMWRHPVRHERLGLRTRLRREGSPREPLHGGGPEERLPHPVGPHGQGARRRPR